MATADAQPRFRFADLLEKPEGFVPMKHKQQPLWDPSQLRGGIPAQLQGVFTAAHVPTLNWGSRDVEQDVPEGTPLVEIDANGAFVAAATSATFAHCALEHTGPLSLPEKGAIPPGYLLMDAHPWQLGAPGSPLGAARLRDTRVWIPHTVASHLRDLTYGASWTPGGHWPDCTVYDSWTSDPVRFTDWAGFVRDTRAANKRENTGLSEHVKVAYSQAVQMWSTKPDPKGTPREQQKKKNRAYRPDWTAALRGQHAMNMWRTAYAATITGHPPLRISDTDRMWFTTDALNALLLREKSPIRLDETGVALSTFKRVRRWYAGIEGV